MNDVRKNRQSELGFRFALVKSDLHSTLLLHFREVLRDDLAPSPALCEIAIRDVDFIQARRACDVFYK